MKELWDLKASRTSGAITHDEYMREVARLNPPQESARLDARQNARTQQLEKTVSELRAALAAASRKPVMDANAVELRERLARLETVTGTLALLAGRAKGAAITFDEAADPDARRGLRHQIRRDRRRHAHSQAEWY